MPSSTGVTEAEVPACRRIASSSCWAAIASLVETCKLNGVEPQRYLAETLTRLVQGWPQARIDELMPWNWTTPATA